MVTPTFQAETTTLGETLLATLVEERHEACLLDAKRQLAS